MPSAGLREEYNDNIFFSTSQPERDFITTLSGGLALQERTERLDLSLTGHVDPRFYVRNPSLNAVDHSSTGNMRYRLMPDLSLSAGAAYIVNSRPDRELATTGLVLTSAIRHRQEYSVSADYVVNEKDVITASGTYGDDSYTGGSLIGVTATTGSVGLTHDLGAMLNGTKGRVNVIYSDYGFKDSANTKVEDYSATVGIVKSLSEIWSFSVDAGVRRTTSRFDTVRLQPILPFLFLVTQERVEDTAWGWLGQIVFSYKGELTSVDLSSGYQLRPASGSAGTTNRTSFIFNASRKVFYELSMNVAAEYFINKSDRNQSGQILIDDWTMRIAPGFRYEFNRDVWIEGWYDFTQVHYRQINETAQRNAVMMMFVYRVRLLE
ncbi:MAG: hypothetical protein L7F78_01300 [Syntrophales bacterium LBB04]|nr:hypothetical protein [Syntrophales bacterium LBB04]